MSLSEGEAIIIGCIVGISLLVVFGLILWYSCHRSDSESPPSAKYAKVPQNGLKELEESPELGKVSTSNGETMPNTQQITTNMHTSSEVMSAKDMHITSDYYDSKDTARAVTEAVPPSSNVTIEVTIKSDKVDTGSEMNLVHNDEKQGKIVEVDNTSNADATTTVHEHDDDNNDVLCICKQHIAEQEAVSVFGQSQSPINIVTKSHGGKNKVVTDEEFEINPLKFNYPEKVRDCTIMNNGHTVQINIGKENKCTLYIHDKIYTLRQFHFHTPSEHTFDDKQYEMEMHLVHTNEENEIAVLGFIFTTQQKRYKPSLTLSKSRMHLVLADDPKKSRSLQNYSKVSSLSPLKIIQEDDQGHDSDAAAADDDDEESDDMGTDSDWESEPEVEEKKPIVTSNDNNHGDENQGNDFLSQFWDQLPAEKTTEDIPLKKPLSFDYLFETASNNFSKNVNTNEIDIDMELFEYMGSLTTPPYTEGVQWLVSKRTHFLSNKQLYQLSSCWGHKNNARQVQDYCGRIIKLRSKSSLKVV